MSQENNSVTKHKISCIVPAYNEEPYISSTLSALRSLPEIDEIIVVDDGSHDQTSRLAGIWADHVMIHPVNRGKGSSLLTGVQAATGNIYLFIDGDLGLSARNAAGLLPPLLSDEADMTVAVLPPARTKGGIGLVKKMASAGIKQLTGFSPRAPLSGQRGLTSKAVEAILSWDAGYGIEVGMTIDILRAGYRLCELEIPFQHRETGRNLRGFYHRGKQFVSVGHILQGKWKRYGGKVISE
ncbi:MAG: glycosyltransferase family 2 protein [Bacillaceae bacterium]|nr:glycosyltransferase family 2 protein [Bacillaceae bacterium]